LSKELDDEDCPRNGSRGRGTYIAVKNRYDDDVEGDERPYFFSESWAKTGRGDRLADEAGIWRFVCPNNDIVGASNKYE
jgi:hypothetical protein